MNPDLAGVGVHRYSWGQDNQSTHDLELNDLRDVEIPPGGASHGDILQADQDGIFRTKQPREMSEEWIAFNDLSDVTVSNIYKHTVQVNPLGEWVNVDPRDLAGDMYLGDLADVTITSPSNVQYLGYQGGTWINRRPDSTEVENLSTVSGATVTAALNGLASSVSSINSAISNLDIRVTALEGGGGPISSDGVSNLSGVPGTTVSDALNNLQSQITGGAAGSGAGRSYFITLTGPSGLASPAFSGTLSWGSMDSPSWIPGYSASDFWTSGQPSRFTFPSPPPFGASFWVVRITYMVRSAIGAGPGSPTASIRLNGSGSPMITTYAVNENQDTSLVTATSAPLNFGGGDYIELNTNLGYAASEGYLCIEILGNW